MHAHSVLLPTSTNNTTAAGSKQVGRHADQPVALPAIMRGPAQLQPAGGQASTPGLQGSGGELGE